MQRLPGSPASLSKGPGCPPGPFLGCAAWFFPARCATIKYKPVIERGSSGGCHPPVSLLPAPCAQPRIGLPPLRPPVRRGQSRRQPAGGYRAGRALYHRGADPHRRRGHPLPGCGEPRRLPGDGQGVSAPDPLRRAHRWPAAAAQARQRGAVQDHPDGFCGSLPLHPAHHPRQRPGGRAGCGGGQ